jgi:hypothetical protein
MASFRVICNLFRSFLRPSTGMHFKNTVTVSKGPLGFYIVTSSLSDICMNMSDEAWERAETFSIHEKTLFDFKWTCVVSDGLSVIYLFIEFKYWYYIEFCVVWLCSLIFFSSEYWYEIFILPPLGLRSHYPHPELRHWCEIAVIEILYSVLRVRLKDLPHFWVCVRLYSQVCVCYALYRIAKCLGDSFIGLYQVYFHVEGYHTRASLSISHISTCVAAKCITTVLRVLSVSQPWIELVSLGVSHLSGGSSSRSAPTDARKKKQLKLNIRFCC